MNGRYAEEVTSKHCPKGSAKAIFLVVEGSSLSPLGFIACS